VDALSELITAPFESGDVVVVDAGGTRERAAWMSIVDDGQAIAGALQRRGVDASGRVAVVMQPSLNALRAVVGIWLAGGSVTMAPFHWHELSAGRLGAATLSKVAAVSPTVVVADNEFFVELETSPIRKDIVSITELRADAATAQAWRSSASDSDIAILQPTSGTTGGSRIVPVRREAVVENVRAIIASAGICHDDVFVSWLPWFHDMGLIGTIVVPLSLRCDVVLADTRRFAAAPLEWLEQISEFRGTISPAPNFAYAMASRLLSTAHGLDLNSWRLAMNGSEQVIPADVRAFTEAGRESGLRSTAPFAVYGLAEATLAVSFPQPELGLSVVTADRAALDDMRFVPVDPEGPGAVQLAEVGSPLRGVELRIAGTRNSLGEDRVGEIQVRGRSVITAYFDAGSNGDRITSDGWLRTGDLGFLHRGRLVVCGRESELIVVAGRNIAPFEVERAVGAVPGVRPGRVVAFGAANDRGTQHLVVVAETREPDAALRRLIRAAVVEAIDVIPREIHIVAPGTVQKTTSGKLQRGAVKREFQTPR
jgi:fatty-acyl-CoA synthase